MNFLCVWPLVEEWKSKARSIILPKNLLGINSMCSNTMRWSCSTPWHFSETYLRKFPLNYKLHLDQKLSKPSLSLNQVLIFYFPLVMAVEFVVIWASRLNCVHQNIYIFFLFSIPLHDIFIISAKTRRSFSNL